MQTLTEICLAVYENSRGGWFGFSSYHMPNIPAHLANNRDDWYTIRLPDALLILRASDVPNGEYEYARIVDRVLVVMNRKTEEDRWIEEEAERNRLYGNSSPA